MKFVVDEVTLLQVSLRVFSSYPNKNMLILPAERKAKFVYLKKHNSF